MKRWVALIGSGFLGLSVGLAQVPETRRGPAAQDVIIQAQPEQPLVVPAGVVSWIAASGFAAILGLGGIIYKRHTDDIKEIKDNHVALGEKVDRHFESIMEALVDRK